MIMIPGPRVVAHLARPFRLINRRAAWIEKFLGIPLTDQDAKSVGTACDASGVTLGAFYHWYLQKKLVSDAIRNLDREQGMALVRSVDYTDYSGSQRLFETDKGILLAVPHHGHYIFSVVALAEKLRKERQVLLFFGAPSRNPGNEVFDHMVRKFYQEGGNVLTIHDNRQGLAKALRALKEGSAVVILPDAYSSEEHTSTIPFCGFAMNIMLGTAILARKTGAIIQPLVSTPYGKGLGFKTEFGSIIQYVNDPAEPDVATKIGDYAVMRRIFSFYEEVMGSQLVYWQQVRKHISQVGTFRELDPIELEQVVELFNSDPALIDAQHIVDLRTR